MQRIARNNRRKHNPDNRQEKDRGEVFAELPDVDINPDSNNSAGKNRIKTISGVRIWVS
jgi:hypothetical protein